MASVTRAEPMARPSWTTDVGLFCAVASAAAFASSGPFAKALIATGWTPAAVVLARIGLAGLLLLGPAWYAVRADPRAVLVHAPVVAVFGALAVAGAQVGYFNAVAHMPIGVALLLEYLGIVLVVAWVWVRGGERPGRPTLVGVALALSGLVLVLDVVGGVSLDAAGVAWGLFAAVGLAAYYVITAGSAARLPPVALAAFGMAGGAAILLGLGAVGAVSLSVSGADVVIRGRQLPWWAAVGELAVVAAAAAYLLGTIGARRLGSTVASFVGLTEVLFAVLLAWLLLGELPGPTQLAGGALILGGVAAVRLGSRAAAAEPRRRRIGAHRISHP
ncbi:MAG: DMT family transporter [Dermatophilaceae bacterium]